MTISLRSAQPADAAHMAALVNLSAEGLPATLWAAQADYGQDPLDVGRERVMVEDGPHSYNHGVIAEVDGQVAGLVMSHHAQHIEIDSGTHPVFRPLVKVENQVPGTRFINVLAVYPQFQSTGVARLLMERVEADPGPDGMSLVVFGNSPKGQAFYRHLGYREVTRVPLVRADWETDQTEWVLMRKAVAAS